MRNEGLHPRMQTLVVEEAPGGFEPPMEVLQTSALPLGYGAIKQKGEPKLAPAERETGLEPATFTLAT